MIAWLLSLCPSWDFVVRVFCVLAALGVLGFLGAVLGIHMVFSAFAPKEG